MKSIINIYKFLFAKNFFYKFNLLIHRLSLSGLGVMDFEGSTKGEKAFLKSYLKEKLQTQ